jgi:hypothetical protein|nr:MAG TPA: hypothetical protein [Caudoviricetes sp.]
MKTKEQGLSLLGRYLKFNEEEIELLREKISSITYNRKGGLLNFSILGNGRIIFLKQKQDGWNIRITGNGPIREGDISLMESVRYNIWSELNE